MRGSAIRPDPPILGVLVDSYSPITGARTFVKVKDAKLSCRRTGQELGRAPFLMVARNRIVLVMMQEMDADDRLSVA